MQEAQIQDKGTGLQIAGEFPLMRSMSKQVVQLLVAYLAFKIRVTASVLEALSLHC